MASGNMTDQILALLDSVRGVKLEGFNALNQDAHPFQSIQEIANHLQSSGKEREHDALQQVLTIAGTPPDHGGLGLSAAAEVSDKDRARLVFLSSAWFEAINSAERSRRTLVLTPTKAAGRLPMNVTEKIFALHDVESKGWVRPGEMIRVGVDWIMASEASWHGMISVYDRLSSPGIFRNDRFWLAGDYVVDPRNMHTPLSQKLMAESERAQRQFRMTEYQGANYTIMHTEFFRERAQPGQLVVGADSHTCSSGAVGCLAVGLGAADVTMALVTGETWFKVPDVVEVRFVGHPSRDVGGKDVIMHVLKELKRNTVAADRVVEYTGPGLRWLGPDARFAIGNMTTEFGGITGIIVPDALTASFISARKTARHRSASHYFRPDADCVYAATYTIDLSDAEPSVARYPRPDDVVPVSEMHALPLDGCFIGACTTAEEDILLGALVLDAGFRMGKAPVARGTRKVVPGSLPILARLRETGLDKVYQRAGFEIGVPGCSYCVGMGADKAAEGEVWLSSQNRNFENRMGKGSIGNLASAATVAASSFDMCVTSPQAFVDMIGEEQWERVRGKGSIGADVDALAEPAWVEPPEPEPREEAADAAATGGEGDETPSIPIKGEHIRSTIFRLGDFIDTDAMAPAQFLVTAKDEAEFGTHCLEFTHPTFRQRVKDGARVVVAGKAFGCGSSRMEAVQALLGAGVKCVIAQSFAFIYSRNQPSLGLLGISIPDAAFYEAAQDGAEIDVDLVRNVATLGGIKFPFELSQMEKSLTNIGGVSPAFNQFGKKIFDVLTSGSRGVKRGLKERGKAGPLAW